MPKKMSFATALAVFILLIALVVVMVAGLGAAPHLPLLVAAVAAALVGRAHGYSWRKMQAGMVDAISQAVPAILIIMVVGVLIGLWMMGGVIPAMVYYGLKIISPRFFLVTALVLCSVVSLALGSSLSTIGTVGVALAGIGSALGVPAPITVGAIVSGAYFGDKMSPFSDTTNLAPAVSGAGLFEHIRHMMGTTVPTYILCLLLFGVIGFTVGDAGAGLETAAVMSAGLEELFWLHPVLLLPPLLVIVMVLFRLPALPGMLGAAALGLVFALIFQGGDLRTAVDVVMNGTAATSAVPAVEALVNRGGLMGMMRTVALMLISLCFAGIFESTGMAAALVERMMRRVKSDRGLVIATVLTAWMILIATGQQYVAIIITGRLMREVYKQRGLAPENLSRALEDSGTVFGAIVPHSTGAVFTESTLGVSAWQYGPYTFFGWINPLVAIALAAMGKGILPLKPSVLGGEGEEGKGKEAADGKG